MYASLICSIRDRVSSKAAGFCETLAPTYQECSRMSTAVTKAPRPFPIFGANQRSKLHGVPS